MYYLDLYWTENTIHVYILNSEYSDIWMITCTFVNDISSLITLIQDKNKKNEIHEFFMI